MLFKSSKKPCSKPIDYPFSTRPVLYSGFDQESSQRAIDDLQAILCSQGLLEKASRRFDAETKAAVEEFQRRNGLQMDGIVGSFTWAALLYPRLSYSKVMIPELQEKVRELQKLLQHEGLSLEVDGYFGRKTQRAVKAFQRLYRLNADGVCGPMTWAVLLSQREKPLLKSTWILSILSWCESFPLEQVLKTLSICLGVYLSPLTQEPSLPETVVTAYGLTCIVPFVLKRLGLKLLVDPSFPISRFAPYVLTGIFWQPVLNVLKASLQ